MSTFSKNLFDILGEDNEVRQPVAAAPAKEQAGERKADKPSKANGGAPRSSAPRGARRGPRQQQNGRPQRGRQFDRHSGTGIVDTEKKVNQSWGHADTAEAEAAKDTISSKDPASEDAAAAAVPEPEEDVKTLDEYLAEKANKSLGVALPEARKANEGSDDSQWKNAVAFVKQEEPDFYTAKESKTTKKASEKQRKEKVVLEIEQRFQEKPRGGFRGGNDRRNADRGDRRGRGNGRRGPKNNNSAPAVNIKDDSAFPSLGA
ncbi:hypothetical protein BX666DRAFT_1875521 [Dichotomocladium elegans]|nr:hypothetical protein BX666DRAFT_1875521 [Dichotomocladium elegans]